jgi:hypothetical protein
MEFTRYLYAKDEVEYSFTISLLNKKEEAVFWAFELLHSGYKDDLIKLIWTTYYDFYYSKNPGYEKYLLTKFKEIEKCDASKNDEEYNKLFYTIISNIMIRPCSLDVFILKNIILDGGYDGPPIEMNANIKQIIKDAIRNDQHTLISNIILNYPTNIKSDKYNISILKTLISIFIENGLFLDESKILKEYNKLAQIHNDFKTLLLSRYANFVTVQKKMMLGKNVYLRIDFDTIDTYNQTYSSEKPYKILSKACIYNIDNNNYLSLFTLKRETENIENAYRYNWLYHASFAPIWKKRIEEYKGLIDSKERKVTFKTDELEEEFYNKYGYEPDEQSAETQNKSIQKIVSQRSWSSFYAEHKNNGFVKNVD